MRPFPPWAQRQRELERQTATRLDKGHGRQERRTLTTTTALNSLLHQLGWKSVQQVFRLVRERTAWDREKGMMATTRETSYGITDMTRMQANAWELLKLTRGHWGIENRLHWVRDETLGEDRCRVRKGSAPQVLSSVRNALISALRLQGIGNLAAAIRSFGRNSQRALAWFGILKE